MFDFAGPKAMIFLFNKVFVFSSGRSLFFLLFLLCFGFVSGEGMIQKMKDLIYNKGIDIQKVTAR